MGMGLRGEGEGWDKGADIVEGTGCAGDEQVVGIGSFRVADIKEAGGRIEAKFTDKPGYFNGAFRFHDTFLSMGRASWVCRRFCMPWT